MHFRAQQIFGALDPYRIIADLKLPLENRNGLFVTPHPQQPERLFAILGQELVGLTYNSPTPACNLFDFLALKLGGYERAVDHVVDHYFNLAFLPGGLMLGSIRVEMIEGLKQDREQFELILALREPLLNHSEELIGAYPRCRGLGLGSDHTWRMLYIARGQLLNQVLRHLNAAVGEDMKKATEAQYAQRISRHILAQKTLPSHLFFAGDVWQRRSLLQTPLPSSSVGALSDSDFPVWGAGDRDVPWYENPNAPDAIDPRDKSPGLD